jgi:hypothetical protein
MIHEFRIEAGAADIELQDDRVVWRLDDAKAVEINEKLTAMRHRTDAGHHYVDISKPTHTLVLSRNEYVSEYQ